MKNIFGISTLVLFFCVFTNYNLKAQGQFVVNGICYFYESITSSTVAVSSNQALVTYSGDIVIPSTVSYGGKSYSVTSIRHFTFVTRIGITSITIPSSVSTIGEGAFYGCSNLPSITIPSDVTVIDTGLFANCIKLASITLPSNLISIRPYAFIGCNSLPSINIPVGVTSIGWNAFENCTALTSITLPNSVTSMDTAVFTGCSSLAAVTLPNNLTSISKKMFQGCSSLPSITIPNSVTSIADSVFFGCDLLASITSLNVDPPIVISTTFNSLNFTKCKIYVPYGSKEKYSNAEYWNQFTNIIELNPAGIENTVNDSVKVYAEADYVVIKGAADGENIHVYSETGMLINTAKVQYSIVKLKLPANQIYNVQIGETTHKVAL